MGVLKTKAERSGTVTVRVPASIKTEIDRLREMTNAAGFDLNATLTEAVVKTTRQIRAELDGLSAKGGERGMTNGLSVGHNKN
jgi:hypothetical protein